MSDPSIFESVLPLLSGAVNLTTEVIKGVRAWGSRGPKAGVASAPSQTTPAEDQEQLRRATEFERHLLRYNRGRDLILLRGNVRLENDRQLLREQHVAEHSPVCTFPGSWLEQTFQDLPPAPLALFNTWLPDGAVVQPTGGSLRTIPVAERFGGVEPDGPIVRHKGFPGRRLDSAVLLPRVGTVASRHRLKR